MMENVMTNVSSWENFEPEFGSEPTYEFKDYYDCYIRLGFKPIPCVGYSKINREKGYDARYKLAKKPTATDFTKQSYVSPSEEKCNEHLESGGWLGWLVPDSLVALDIENKNEIEMVLDILKHKGIKPIIHKTNNGIHLIFRNPNQIKGNQKTLINLGFEITYRIGSSNYLILAPCNYRTWDCDIENLNESNIPELPELLYPIKNASQDNLLESISYQLSHEYCSGNLCGYDDLDTSFMGWLAQDLNIGYGQIQELFKIVFRDEFDEKQTELMYNRIDETRDLKKGGSLIFALQEKGLTQIILLIDALQKGGGNRILEVPFPEGVLPEELDLIAHRLADFFSVHYEYAVMAMLTIVSSVIGNGVRVVIQEGHTRSPFLWFSIVAPSGYGKSPILNKLLKPIYELQAKEHELFSIRMADYDQLDKKEQKSTDKPKLCHHIASDFTFETLVDFFSTNPKGILISKDELAGLFSGMNQYRNGKGNDEQNFLQLFDSGPLKVDRATKGFKFCKKSGASVIGGIQPILFKDIFTLTKSFDGTLSRFLIMVLKKKPFKYNKNGVSDNEMEPWRTCIANFDSQLGVSVNNPVRLNFSPETLDLFSEYVEKMNNEIEPKVSEYIKVFIPKLNTYCAHFAGLICLLENIKDFDHEEFIRHYQVMPHHLEKAIQLTDYFLYQSSIVREMLTNKTVHKKNLEYYIPYLAKALKENTKHIEDGKLTLKLIKDSMNLLLPDNLRLKDKSKRLDSILESVGISCEIGRARTKHLIWQDLKCKELIEKYC